MWHRDNYVRTRHTTYIRNDIQPSRIRFLSPTQTHNPSYFDSSIFYAFQNGVNAQHAPPNRCPLHKCFMMPCPVPDVHVCKYARRIYVIIYLEMDKKRNITHNLPHRQRRNKLANKSESSPSRGDATQRICTRVARLLFAVCMFLCIFRVRREPLLLWFGYWMRKHEKSLRKKVTSKILWHKSVLRSVFGGIVACLV